MNLDRTTCSDFKHSIGVPENIGAVPFDQKAFEIVQHVHSDGPDNPVDPKFG